MGDDATRLAIADPHARMPRWLPHVAVTVVVVALALLPLPGEAFVAPPALTVMLTVAAVAVLPARSRWPIRVLAAALALFAIAAFARVPTPGLAFAVAVAAFGVTARRGRSFGLWVTGVTLLAVAALTFVGTGSTIDPRVVQFTLTVLVGAAMGDASRSRREYIAAVTERAERAEQTREVEARRRVSEERLRIARDLHDTVAHQISVISLNAGAASSAFDTRPDRAKQSLQTIRRAARTVLAEIGGLLEVLRADEDTSLPGPQPRLDQVEALARRFSDDGLAVSVRVQGAVSGVSGAAGTVAYAVVREALTNAHKHGSGHRADVLLTLEGDVLGIEVTNPLDREAVRQGAPSSGWGLTGLRERAAAVRGTVQAGPDRDGWRVSARLPVVREYAP